jgi:hypothetical protein
MHDTAFWSPCLQATPRRCGHRTPRSSPPPRELCLILALLEPEKPAQLSSLSHSCKQLPRSAAPFSATPPRCSAARLHASHRRSGCAKATSLSTIELGPPPRTVGRCSKPTASHPAPSLPSRSASTWTGTSGHGTAPPTHPRAPYHPGEPRRPLWLQYPPPLRLLTDEPHQPMPAVAEKPIR